MATERLVCAYEHCTNAVTPGESQFGKNGLLYCSYRCAARDQFPGPTLPWAGSEPALN